MNKQVQLKLAALGALIVFATAVLGYPFDGLDESGIRRLHSLSAPPDGAPPAGLRAGQMWRSADIRLHLTDYDGPDFDQLPPDPALASFLAQMLRHRHPSYAMVLLDISDPAHLRWAGLRPDLKQNPGSVGKLLCMAALFHTLAQAFPEIEDRERVLREAVSSAGSWVSNEIHVVPKWSDVLHRNLYSVINSRDAFRLSEWLDHAISASANGAGAIIWREAMLIRHFGGSYPQSAEENDKFFAQTPKSVLSALARAVVTEPLIEAGINTDQLQQGSFFTSSAKQKVPGTVSFATPRELARLLFRIEQGRLVDRWSSLQMKKYMYLTKRRYRYSYAPELRDAAVFFKSGSLYSCRPEEGFVCAKYMGNAINMMNSTAMVEGSGDSAPRYIVTLMSNVAKFNSAWDHSRIAAAVHETMRTNQPQSLRESASAREITEAGTSE